MAAVGGDIIEITVNHPTLGEATFYPVADEDFTFDPGGKRTEDDQSAIDGGGRPIRKITQKRWKISGPISWDMNGADEVAFLSDLAANPVEGNWTVAHINGVIWGGKGSPVGDFEANTTAATFTLNVSGGGVMRKIVG